MTTPGDAADRASVPDGALIELPPLVTGYYELRTGSGSVYRLTCEASEAGPRWWLWGGGNVPNPHSRELPSGKRWEILPPTAWGAPAAAVILGSPAVLLAPPYLAIDDPGRCPGGGKVTSPVREVRLVAWCHTMAWPEEEEPEAHVP